MAEQQQICLRKLSSSNFPSPTKRFLESCTSSIHSRLPFVYHRQLEIPPYRLDGSTQIRKAVKGLILPTNTRIVRVSMRILKEDHDSRSCQMDGKLSKEFMRAEGAVLCLH